MDQPRIALVLLRAGWLGCAGAQSLSATMGEDQTRITTRLQQNFILLDSWIVDSTQAVDACRQGLRETQPDLVILAFQTMTDQPYLEGLLHTFSEFPIVLWCYVPWRRFPHPVTHEQLVRGSGPAGAFDAMGLLHNLQVPFLFTYGAPDDPRLLHDLNVAGQAARVRRAVLQARIGVLPGYPNPIQGVRVDADHFSDQLGPAVQVISSGEYRDAVAAVAPEALEAYLDRLQSLCQINGVSAETLAASARASLGLQAAAQAHKLDLLALNEHSPDLIQAAGLRPSLPPDLLEPGGLLYQPEADLGAAMAGLVLARLTGSPVFFLHLWFWDEARNQLIGGHSGLQDPRLADEGKFWIGPDHDICHPASQGAQIQFIARHGRVTLFQIRASNTGWQAVAATGICIDTLSWIDTCPHAVLRIDPQIDYFLKRLAAVGSSSYWVMVYGSLLEELDAFCKLSGIQLEVIH